MDNDTELAIRARELEQVIEGLTNVIDSIKAEAEQMGVSPYLLKDMSGHFVIAEPLSALAQAEASLAAVRFVRHG